MGSSAGTSGGGFNAGADGELWYYGALLEAFRATPAAPPRLVGEFARVVGELQRLVQTVQGDGSIS